MITKNNFESAHFIKVIAIATMCFVWNVDAIKKLRVWKEFEKKDASHFLALNGNDQGRLVLDPVYNCMNMQIALEETKRLVKDIEATKGFKAAVATAVSDWWFVADTYANLKKQMINTRALLNSVFLMANLGEKKIISETLAEQNIQSAQQETRQVEEAEIKGKGARQHLIDTIYHYHLDRQEPEVPWTFDYERIGKLFADMLYTDGFVCLSIPEASLFIFQIFYYKLIEEEHIDKFFVGFLSAFTLPTGTNVEARFKHLLQRLFLTFNLDTFLMLNHEYLERLMKAFSVHYPGSGEANRQIASQFGSFYRFFIKNLKAFETKTDKETIVYFKLLIEGSEEEINDLKKRAGIFALVSVYQEIKKFAVKAVTYGVMEGEVHQLIENIESYVYEGEEERVMEPGANPLLEDDKFLIGDKQFTGFAQRFETKMANCESCQMCDTPALYYNFYELLSAPGQPII